ncbi:MAG: HDOD domain-containing protein [Myxococcales bacterium]|nr:HDOD domain-containing protein [Myxococcales bacterium]
MRPVSDEIEPFIVDDDFFERRLDLPALPKVAQQVYALSTSDAADAREIAKLIDQDAAFAAHILKVVNSAYYSLPVAVSNVRFAIAYLGLGEVSRIALALSVMRTLATEDRALLEAFWVRSYHAALISRRVSRSMSFSKADAENLYIASLLHDLGKLVYAIKFPRHFAKVTDYVRQHGCRLVEAERALGFATDSELGVRLCEHWRLPSIVRLACAHHELEDLRAMQTRGDQNIVVVAVCVASLLSVLCVLPLSEERKRDISREVQRVLGLEEPGFLMLMSDIYELRDEAKRTVRALL